MFENIPVQLILYWSIFTGSLHANRTHMKHYLDKNISNGHFVFLTWYTTLGWLIGFVAIIIYFTKVSWFYPLILIVITFITAPVWCVIVDVLIGREGNSTVSVLLWPLTLLMAFRTILAL